MTGMAFLPFYGQEPLLLYYGLVARTPLLLGFY